MSRIGLNQPLQRAQPYAPKRQQPVAKPAPMNDEKQDEIQQLKSSLNAGPTVGRLASLQRVANTAPVQRNDDDEIQQKAIQRAKDDEEIQAKSIEGASAAPVTQAKSEEGGLPSDLKAGIESLSGMSMDGVQVHRNSSKPATVQAHAYAQGTDIHLAPGQDKHLAHEAWHVVQQAEGRVQPTTQLAGVSINDDAGLEKEADVMGAKAASVGASAVQQKSIEE